MDRPWHDDDADEEDVSPDADAPADMVCPQCRGWVSEETVKCPHCAEWITPVDPSRAGWRRWVYLAAVGLMTLLALWMAL
jgi:hypothetical protein